MTGLRHEKTSDAPAKDQTKDVATSSPPWLPVALTLLGSTGVVSVFGPLTGELYWEGYLAAFGLTPQEFPALPSHVSKFAYRAILEWTNGVLIEVWALLPYVVSAVVASVIASALLKLPWLKSRWQSMTGRMRQRYRSESPAGWTLQAVVKLALILISLFIVGYVAVVALLLLITPIQARHAGLHEGQRQRQIYLSKAAGSSLCETVQAAGFVFACPTVVAYGDKSLAVLDGLKIYRVPRDGLRLSSTVPPASPSSSAARTTP